MVQRPSVAQPRPAATEAPNAKPSVVPGPARKNARFAAITRVRTNAPIMIGTNPGPGGPSRLIPAAFAHCLTNSTGEYQSAPSANIAIAAATTASQLTCGMIDSPNSGSII